MQNKLTAGKIIGCAYKVYNTINFGFPESVYDGSCPVATGKDVGLLLIFTEDKVEVKWKIRTLKK